MINVTTCACNTPRRGIFWVDDIIVASSSLYVVNDLKKSLACKFQMNDLGEKSAWKIVNLDRHLVKLVWIKRLMSVLNLLMKSSIDKY